MTTNDWFDRRLVDWLDGQAGGRVPDHLAEVLLTTRATRQRSGWSSLERWLPVTSIASARLTWPRPIVPLLLVIALLIAAMAALVLGQAGRSSQIPPFGGAANGRIVYVDGASVRSVAADGTDPRTIATLSAPPSAPVISPDGQRVAYTADGKRIEILAVTGTQSSASVVTAAGISDYGPATWSPSGSQIAFVGADARSDHVFVANADGTNVHEVAGAMVERGHVVVPAGFSPDGRFVAFAEGPDHGTARLVVVAPDGSEARVLTSNLVEPGFGAAVAWSPDPATPRLLYLAYGGPTYYHDMRTDADVYVAIGFWPSWSPTGDRISYWSNGTKVIGTPASSSGARTPIEVFRSFTDNCQDHPELAGQALCGPVTWSPDGSRLIATEVTGNGLLSLRSDGSGDPRFVDLATNVDVGAGGVVAWQPVVRPQ
jgi:Tol biopolymer transport system component